MDLIKNIQITATWLAKVNNDFESNLFRTPELIPDKDYIDMDDEERLPVLEKLCVRRAELLTQSDMDLIAVEDLHEHGRVFYCDTHDAIPDGGAAAETYCFIDDEDAPPQDTWLTIGKQLNDLDFFQGNEAMPNSRLIAWVPKSHYFYVQGGIDVSMFGTFDWAKNENISDDFAILKPIFQAPDIIREPNIRIGIYQKYGRLGVILEEAAKKKLSLPDNHNTERSTGMRFLQWLFGRQKNI